MKEMTITERFAKFTTEELAEALNELRAKVEYNRRKMVEFEKENEIELYEVEKDAYEANNELMLDVKCALESR